jgi:hypothetical protein
MNAKEPPKFSEYFSRVWDTRLVCPRCKNPIFFGLTKRDKTNRSGPNYAYACSCMEVTDKRVLKMDRSSPNFRLSRWEWLLEEFPADEEPHYPDFQRPDAQTKCVRAPLNQKPGIFDPGSVRRGKVSRTKEWEHTLRIAIEAVEKLLELQESFNESAANLPEAFADSAKGQYYDQIVDVDLGAVHKALVELYDAQAIEEPPR